MICVPKDAIFLGFTCLEKWTLIIQVFITCSLLFFDDMDRRDFLKVSVVSSIAVALPAGVFAKNRKAKEKKGWTNLPADGYVTEPAIQIPVVADADVVVVGGGPAGVTASIAAARQGVGVLLIERYNHLGGLWIGGQVLPVLSTYGRGYGGSPEKVVLGIGDEICRKMVDMGIAMDVKNKSTGGYDPTVDPEGAKYFLDTMIEQSGVKMMYFSQAAGVHMSGDRIDALIVECKSGRVAIRCRAVVDTSGDGDVFAWAGEKFRQIPYHIGLMSRLGNVDRINREAPGFEAIRGIRANTPIPSVSMMHMVGERNQDGLDVFNLSRLQVKYRKEIFEKVEAIKKKPGYEEVFLLDTASQLGVRVTRVLEAMHTVTLEDSMNYKHYDDVIGLSGASDSVNYNAQKVVPAKRPVWQIPYRALLPKNTQNLLVAGRCFSFDDGLAWDAREIGTCFVTGQAAGTAAAMAVLERRSTHDIDIDRLHSRLLSENVRLDF